MLHTFIRVPVLELVAKDGRFVVRTVEWQGSTQVEFILEGYE